ncbi:MAG: hypothetical protein M3R36_11570 [Bacteroidota bacterium]|nr:hypothetical protein [Bacteroidota bacterium]
MEGNDGSNAEWYLVCWTAALTIVTLLLAIVAALQDIIRRWFYKAKLDLDLKDFICTKELCKGHPDSVHHQINRMFKGEYESKIHFNRYYFRAMIKNVGNISAENVEVILSDVKKYENNNWIEKKDFLSDNLIWSSFSPRGEIKIYCEYISPKTKQYINIGRIYDPHYFRNDNYKDIFGEEFPIFHLSNQQEFLFCFDVNFKNNNQSYIIDKGKYKFSLTIGAANCSESIKREFELEITGKWEEKENIFYNKELILSEISRKPFQFYKKLLPQKIMGQSD